MKHCRWCNETKDLEEFYKHPRMKDGRLNKCRTCQIECVRNAILRDPEKRKKYEQSRNTTEVRKQKRGTYQTTTRNNYPERYKARGLVATAIASGRLIPQVCIVCGGTGEAHHPDYSRPLDVVWLCSEHHKETHALIR